MFITGNLHKDAFVVNAVLVREPSPSVRKKISEIDRTSHQEDSIPTFGATDCISDERSVVQVSIPRVVGSTGRGRGFPCKYV